MLKFLWILLLFGMPQLAESTPIFNFLLLLGDEDVSITFVPTHNIGINQLAYYQCWSNHTEVFTQWLVVINETKKMSTTRFPDMVEIGAGSPNSSLTLPAYYKYNNTVVICLATGDVDGTIYMNSSNATLRIQGKLTDVKILSDKKEYCIDCSWSPPFSLDGVPIYGYIINVTNEGDNTQYSTEVSNTTSSWSYCPSQFGTYTISIAGNNSAGEGNISTTLVTIPTVTISAYVVAGERVTSNWTTTCNIENATFLEDNPSYILAYLTPISHDTSPIDGQGSGQFEGDTFIGTVNMGVLPDKKKWLISFSLVYNSGLCINVSQPTEFTTFDVQNGSLEVIDSTTGEVCFTCHFVTGSQSQGCYIEYECIIINFNGNITIKRTSMRTNATKCVNGIYTCDYNVTFYDMDYNNTIYKDDYAVKLTNQSVTGLSPTNTTSHLSTIIGSVVGGIVGLLILTLIVVGSVIVVIGIRKCYKKNCQQEEEDTTDKTDTNDIDYVI